MPRSGGRSGGGRSSAGSSRSAHTSARQPSAPAAHQQQQQHSNVPAQHQQPGQRAPGLFGQMASTAAGVAVGSTVGHGLSGMLFGGGAAAEAPQAPPQQQSFEERKMGGACEIQAKDFTRCLEATNNDMGSCSFYLDQLKACQVAAAPY